MEDLTQSEKIEKVRNYNIPMIFTVVEYSKIYEKIFPKQSSCTME
jgi:hypothetical protein